MIRHVFVAPVREGVSEKVVDAKVAEMEGLACAVEGIEGFSVGRSLGFVGPSGAVAMVVDFADEAAFHAFVSCDLHQRIAAGASEAFEVEGFALAQIAL